MPQMTSSDAFEEFLTEGCVVEAKKGKVCISRS